MESEKLLVRIIHDIGKRHNADFLSAAKGVFQVGDAALSGLATRHLPATDWRNEVNRQQTEMLSVRRTCINKVMSSGCRLVARFFYGKGVKEGQSGTGRRFWWRQRRPTGEVAVAGAKR